jgi:RNA polymerase-binding transcription factor DksA
VDETTIDRLEAAFDQIDDALRRLDDGSYGRCDVCGEAIPDEVLADDPVARRHPEHARAAAPRVGEELAAAPDPEPDGDGF